MTKKVILISLATLMLSVVLGGLSGYFVARITQSVHKAAKDPPSTKTEENWSADKNVSEGTAMTAVDVAQSCTKSVVNIEVETIVKNYTGGREYSKTAKSYGTGVVMRKDGYIATCYHVVEDADKITIIMNDDTKYTAELVGYDEQFDLAVVHVDSTDLEPVAIGDVDILQSGEGVVIIGNPLGEFGASVSVGVISSTEREVTVGDEPLRLIQTDAAINPGNSGGGMFNMQGQFIGMVNAKMSAAGIEGLGFAIPINTIHAKIDAFINKGEVVKKAVLGVSTKAATCYIDNEQINCVEITSIRENSAASQANLRVGDYLLSANGKKITSNDDLTILVKYSSPGDSVEFQVWRDNKHISVTVMLGSSK